MIFYRKERERERWSGVNFSQASSVFNSWHCFEAGVVVSRNFSISIPPVSPLERHHPSFLPSPPSCTLPDIFRYSITATQDIAGERGRVRCRKNVINRTPSSPLSCCSRCGCTRGTGLLYIYAYSILYPHVCTRVRRGIYTNIHIYVYIYAYRCELVRSRNA